MAAEFLRASGFDLSGELEKAQFGDAPKEKGKELGTSTESGNLQRIVGVRLPRRPYLWDVHLANGRISELRPHDFNSPLASKDDIATLEARGCLLAPSLCHAHIHLDKCFLLQDPKFRDLKIVKGDFGEAMSLATEAKKRFTRSDLLRRGRQLIIESIQAGVTAMRAFCEVDGVVGRKCLNAGLELRKEFEGRCDVQICAFAQLPVFSGEDDGAEVRRLMEDAAKREGVDVVGSTPYVEDAESKQMKNVEWMVDLAMQNGKALDFHMDYTLDQEKAPTIWDTIDMLKQKDWMGQNGRNITCGHCTRWTYFNDAEWKRLKEEIWSAGLSMHFVGLPTSDLFMMRSEQRYRGTLHVLDMIGKYDLQAAIAVNNVGNAFTPQGNCDPLGVASLAVGLYSAGTESDTELLYECVSSRAKDVIGMEASGLDVAVGSLADFVIFEKSYTKLKTRKSIAEVVYDPSPGRFTIKNGRIVSK